MNAYKHSIVGIVLFFITATAIADINVGIFPRRKAGQMYTMFKPITEQLSTRLGEKVNLIVPKNFKAFWKDLNSGRFDLVHYNQYHYIKSHKELGYNVILANKEFGDKKVSGMVAVRTDSGINTIEELKGKTVMFGGGKKAMMSYIIPTYLLKQQGLRPGIDYQEKFALNPFAAIIATYDGHADAVGNGEVILSLKRVKQRVDIGKIKILSSSKPVIFLPWAVKKDMNVEKINIIQNFMVDLKNTTEGKKMLKKAMINEFYVVEDKEYDYIRELVEKAIGEKY